MGHLSVRPRRGHWACRRGAEGNTANVNSTGDNIVQRARQMEIAELARYWEDLKMVRGSCLLCRAGDNRWDQAFSTCHRRHDMLGQRTKARQRHASDGQQWLRPYMACFWCLNPQSVCRQANPETHVESSSCEENNLVLPLCDGIFDSAHDSGWLHDQFGRRFDTIAEYLDWLGKESSFGGDRTIQAVRVAAAALADFRAASSAPILPRCLHTIDWYDSSTTLGFGLWYTQLLLVRTLGCEDNKDSRRGRSSWIRSNRNGGVKSAPSQGF